ncbi:hypothetical protein HMPREF2767_08400 [Nosocomiicoccus sp. HMSC067E10]|uniref:exonuclease SbcCD subunit D n=1 Tax=Nosocomiicoccus sp. HMSC067E10 TaxID=1739271 RepID=UPI0008A44AAB|nr:exonuclease SbcCD subunit D [Nosocomiicoccus sp. HMSC067E10]OFL48102.1 hypothetical protein HMPREF2767_08400 [Nosocomiicoccus sp. HMSC067E10]
MKILHTADWHIGKRLNRQSLIDDQRYVLDQLLTYIDENEVDAVVIAGDLYDKKQPSQEAMNVLNYYLKEINLVRKKPLFLISGNHDSKPYIDARSEWFQANHFYVNTELKNCFTPVTFNDVDFYLLPYIEIPEVRHYFNDDTIDTFEKAYRRVIDEITNNFKRENNILVGHLFVSGSKESESEEKITIGLTEEVSHKIFEPFDFTLLGHLHRHNAFNSNQTFYSGAIMKYSFDEANDKKGFKVIDTDKNTVEFIEFELLHDLIHFKGSFKDIITGEVEIEDKDAYIKFELTDMEGFTEPMTALKQLYKNTLVLSRKIERYENDEIEIDTNNTSDDQIFKLFYEKFTGREPTEFEFETFNKHLRGITDETN